MFCARTVVSFFFGVFGILCCLISFGFFIYQLIKKICENREVSQTKTHSISMSHLIDAFEKAGGHNLGDIIDFVVTCLKSRKNTLILRGKLINKTKRIIDYIDYILIFSDKSDSQKYNTVLKRRTIIPGSDCWDFNLDIGEFYGNPEDIVCVHLKVIKLKFVDMNKPVLE